MDKHEQIAYLANVYRVLVSDDQIERVEDRAFEEIAREMHAGYVERKRAQEAASAEGFQLRLASRYSDRLKNLEDMLFVAFCNRVLEPAEKAVIKLYAQQLGISQKQLDVIKGESKSRCAEYVTKMR